MPGRAAQSAAMTGENGKNGFRQAGQALLEWYVASGIDAALESEPVNRLAERPQQAEGRAAETADFDEMAPDRAAPGGGTAPALRRETPAAAPKPVQPDLRATGEQALSDGRRLAAEASDLAQLEAALAGYEGCGLRETAKNLCFADGNPEARIMLIGEAPGRDEDIQGKPFVGRAGQLLDRMLAAIGLDRDSVYITNTVFWRPPGNRTPTPQETALCRPFTERQVELVRPDMVVLLGAVAARHLLATNDGILRLRGRWRQIEIAGRQIPVMATLHPAYLLRNPSSKRLAWRDFLAIRAALEGTNPS